MRSTALVGALVATVLVALPGFAQDKAGLIRALRDASDFRVRVQAAFALGNTQDPTVRTHLERGLRDSNPAVRAAAATALGRLGQRSALRALRRARRDSSAAVRMQVERSIRTLAEPTGMSAQPSSRPTPNATGDGFYPAVSVVPRASRVAWPRVRYVVVLGDMANRSSYTRGSALMDHLRSEVHRNLRVLRGVAVFDSADQIGRDAARQIRRRRLPKLQLNGNLTEVQRRRARGEFSVRCEVSLMLLAEGNLRGMMSGAATGSEQPRRDRRGQETRLAQQALAAAVRSAMSGVPGALAQAANR